MSSSCSSEGFGWAIAASVMGFSPHGIRSNKWPRFGSFHGGLASSGIRDIVAVELHLRDHPHPDRLNGCGLVVINPPYEFERHARVIADAVLEGLGDGEIGAGTAVDQVGG